MTTIDHTYAVTATVQAARVRDILNAAWHGHTDQIPEWMHEGIRTGRLDLDQTDGLLIDLRLQDPDHWLIQGVTGHIFTTTDHDFRTTYKPATVVHHTSVDNRTPCCGQPLFDILDRGEMTSTDRAAVNCQGKTKQHDQAYLDLLATATNPQTAGQPDLSSVSPAADPSTGVLERLRRAAAHPFKGSADTDASMLVAAAERVEGGYAAGGSNTQAMVGRVLRLVAEIVAESEPAPWGRPWTADEETAGGGKRITAKRACNGCGRLLGDVSDAEMDAVLAGAGLPDVRVECGCVDGDYHPVASETAAAGAAGPVTPAGACSGGCVSVERLTGALRALAKAGPWACMAIPPTLRQLAELLEASAGGTDVG